MEPEEVIIWLHDDNPKLNSIVFNFKLSNGQDNEHASNLIADIILTEVDVEGFTIMLIDSIKDCRKMTLL